MRVLMANKFWSCTGGVERVMFDEIRWLEAEGHSVAHFAADDPRNECSPWSRYFPPFTDISDASKLSAPAKVQQFLRTIRNRDAAIAFAELIADFQPDVIHVHAIHRHLTPSILLAARAARKPVVMTMHDYNLACAGHRLLKGDGTLCTPQECGWHHLTPAVRNKCVKGSAWLSAAAACEMQFQRLTRAYERTVSTLIAPSRFMASRIVSAGLAIPVAVVPNAVEPGIPSPRQGGDLFFAGRLVEEKGIRQLIEAAKSAGVRVVIVGDGPLASEVATSPSADFRGWLPETDLRALMLNARAVFVPSQWHENAPLAALEPMSMGLPVIATRVGGTPEIVSHMETGLLVPMGDVNALANAMRLALDDPALMARLGSAARRAAETRFSPGQHTRRLVEVYIAAIEGQK